MISWTPKSPGVVGVAAAAIVAVLSAGCTSNSPNPTPTASIQGVVVFTGLGHKHLSTHITYPQNPPIGGDHAPYPLACAVYNSPVPNEFAVHSLEHGAVWLTYQPDLSSAEVQTLAGLATLRSAYVLVSPYPGQPGLIEATAWGLQLTVTNVNDPRLKQFVQLYAGGGQGGEPGATCQSGVTPQQASTLIKN